MAKKSTKDVSLLPGHTIITVVARKNGKVHVKDMTYDEGLKAKEKNKSFQYTFYQKGYCEVKPTEDND